GGAARDRGPGHPGSGRRQRVARRTRYPVDVGRGPGAIAQRSVRTTAAPAGRTTAASVTGSHGSHSGRRAQRGSVATAAPASTAYGGRTSAGSGGRTSRNR